MNQTSYVEVPPGTYNATFFDVISTYQPEYGSCLQWKFLVDDRNYPGLMVSQFTNHVPSESNLCGKFFHMVLGIDLKYVPFCTIGETIDHFGCPGKVTVERAPSGKGLRVTKFVRENDDQTVSEDP